MTLNKTRDKYEQFREEISKLDSSDFDGHTCFKDLTPEQRIDWLAELVVFVYQCRELRSENRFKA